MKKLKLFIAVPSTHIWEATFGMSLVFMTNHLAAHPIEGFRDIEYQIFNKRGSLLANMRQWLLERAIKEGYTHLLFVDSDQTFPPDLVHRLISHDKQVVACNIATKKMPPDPTARQHSLSKIGGELVYSHDQTGLEQVWRVGTGIMLIDLNLFKRKGMEPPWFNQRWNEGLNSYVGEDWGFCEKLQKAGVKIFVDHDLSVEVGHIGPLNYGHDMIAMHRQSIKGAA